jgi:hypothetical protein
MAEDGHAMTIATIEMLGRDTAARQAAFALSERAELAFAEGNYNEVRVVRAALADCAEGEQSLPGLARAQKIFEADWMLWLSGAAATAIYLAAWVLALW